MPIFENKGPDFLKGSGEDDEDAEGEGSEAAEGEASAEGEGKTPVLSLNFEQLPPEIRQALLSGMATKVAEALMIQALSTAAKMAAGMPNKDMVLAVLQGAAAGLNRAVGCLEGDIAGNAPPDFKDDQGHSIEEILAGEREKQRLLGRQDRERGKAAALEALKQKVVEEASGGRAIGFKMPGPKKPADPSMN